MLSQCGLVFLLVGMVASGRVSRSRSCFLRPVVLPDSSALGARLPGLSSYCLRHVQVACSCRSCSSHPSPSLFFLAKTSASRVSLAPDSERAITFGSFSLLGIALRPRLLLTKLARWRGSSGAWLPFSFSFEVVVSRHSEDTEKGAGMGLPVGLFLFQL